MTFSPRDIEACANKLHENALADEQREREIDSKVDDEIIKLLMDPIKWQALNMDGDEQASMLFSEIFKMALFKSKNQLEVGMFVIAMARKIVQNSVEAEHESEAYSYDKRTGRASEANRNI